MAARILLDRAWPVRKGRPVTFMMPPVNKPAADIARASAGILEATARGELTPDEAAALAGIIEAHRRAIELTEVEERIAPLEARQDETDRTT